MLPDKIEICRIRNCGYRFLKSRYQIGEDIATISDVNFEKRFITGTVKYDRKVQRVLPPDKFRSSGNKRNILVLVSSSEEEEQWPMSYTRTTTVKNKRLREH